MAKNKNAIKIFRREYIPLVIACSVLVLLIVALVITIINKPKKDDSKSIVETPKIQERVVPNNSCNSEEYNKLIDEASKITAGYMVNDHYDFGCGFSVVEGAPEGYDEENCPDDQRVTGWALDVMLESIPENVEVIVTNNLDNQKLLFTRDNDNQGSIIWSQPETTRQRTYNFKVYSKLDSCNDTLIREFEINLPRWNELSKMGYCDQEEYKATELCERFVFSDWDFNEEYTVQKKIVEKVEKEKKEKKEKEEKEQKLAKNSVYIIIAIVVVAIVTVGIVFILMKGRKKNEKK